MDDFYAAGLKARHPGDEFLDGYLGFYSIISMKVNLSLD
jgi:hypothetical protein